ncbi:right-handed parallel beta-helix repeat-containing protein [Reichenbachiella agarivorans]|uniref:Right-handed parallel beta-helix repeat-containing protein n=1 Tax=Reichenbachiella agarivorans TaxID=2979464 RepID=A0ABY6CQC4_9BACT|nr:right-handed parallel beta-helix repeat-containing protein [Reichenbachiella agarivorans]UXP32702.1 right-handed parallel beta-helix repeat-containing protein [Reichenbachiella agarivorans]
MPNPNLHHTIPVLLLFTLLLSSSCKEDEVRKGAEIITKEILGCTNPLSESYDPKATTNDGSCAATDCSTCNFFISGDVFGFDGVKKGVKPGDIICLDGTVTYKEPLSLSNIVGTADNPVLIINCGGQAVIDMSSKNASYAIRTSGSKYFRISGAGSNDHEYGIVLSNTKSLGISLDGLSSNFEVDHLEIFEIGFAGIMSKTDPSCDAATQRDNFVMQDISIHDNYVHDTGGEGLYIGNSFYEKGRNLTDCGTVFPHDIKGADIYRNKVINAGWEAIQVGCGVEGVKIHDNYIENYGTENETYQNNGLQIGEGTGGLLYNNYIAKGPGNGVIMLGLGDNIMFNNVIVNAGESGVFCDERYTPGDGFSFINNTIINPEENGIVIYAEKVPLNHVINNVIVNPGAYKSEPEKAYIKKLNNDVKIDIAANFFTQDIAAAGFEADGYLLSADSELIDTGEDVSDFGVTFDFIGTDRPSGTGFDPGAYEYKQ